MNVSCNSCSLVFRDKLILDLHFTLVHQNLNSKKKETNYTSTKNSNKSNLPPFQTKRRFENQGKDEKIQKHKSSARKQKSSMVEPSDTFFDKEKTKENHLSCHFCNSNCVSNKDLKMHMNSVHNEAKLVGSEYSSIKRRDFFSEKAFDQKSSLVHEEIKTEESKKNNDSSQEKRYLRINQNSSLHKENKLHGCEKKVIEEKHKCEICKISFTFKQDFQIHILFFHDKKKSHKCNLCKIGFSKERMLIRHSKLIHEWKSSINYTSKELEEDPNIFSHLLTESGKESKIVTESA